MRTKIMDVYDLLKAGDRFAFYVHAQGHSANHESRRLMYGWMDKWLKPMEATATRLVNLRIKPHHFLDIIADFGAGSRSFKPHAYGHAVHTVAERLLANRNIEIELVLGIDDICRPCKHHVGDTCDDTIDTSFRPEAPPSKEEWNKRIDRRWFERLGLKEGDRMTASEFCRIVREKMGGIYEIYREIPRQMTADRERNLLKGIAFYLNEPAGALGPLTASAACSRAGSATPSFS